MAISTFEKFKGFVAGCQRMPRCFWSITSVKSFQARENRGEPYNFSEPPGEYGKIPYLHLEIFFSITLSIPVGLSCPLSFSSAPVMLCLRTLPSSPPDGTLLSRASKLLLSAESVMRPRFGLQTHKPGKSEQKVATGSENIKKSKVIQIIEV